jgi:hypothetical protein
MRSCCAPRSDYRAGVLIFGRPEATRCYDGKLTYGSLRDVRERPGAVRPLGSAESGPRLAASPVYSGRRVLPARAAAWLHDRRGVWRSTLASTVIEMALARVGYDYLTEAAAVLP